MLVAVFAGLLGCQTEQAPAESGALRVLTYNVHGLPSGITGDDTSARIASIAPRLPAYDLLGLQEAWIAEDREVLTAECEHAVEESFDEPVDAGRAYGAGLITLGPDPASLVHEQYYTRCHGTLDGASDCLASKGFQLLRFELGAGSLDVYNTHFEAGNGEEDIAARESNVAELLEAIATHSEGRAVLLMGDTNLSGDDATDAPALAALFDAGLADACDMVGCPEPGRIDRFLLRNGDEVRLIPGDWAVPPEFVDEAGVPLSDHDPIELTLEWALLEPVADLPR